MDAYDTQRETASVTIAETLETVRDTARRLRPDVSKPVVYCTADDADVGNKRPFLLARFGDYVLYVLDEDND